MSYTVSITSKGQMTVPKALREQYSLDAPGKAVLDPQKDGTLAIRKPVPLEDIHKIIGKPAGRDDLTEREKLIGPYLAKKYGVR